MTFEIKSWVPVVVTSVIAGYLVNRLESGAAGVLVALGCLAVLAGLSSGTGAVWRVMWRGGVRRLHANQTSFVDRVAGSVDEAHVVRIMGGRGMDLVGRESVLGNALRERDIANTRVRILLLRRDSKFLQIRPKDLNIEAPLYRAECAAVDEYLALLRAQSGGAIEARYYSQRRVWRLLFLDNVGFVGHQVSEAKGSDIQHYELRRVGRGSLFESFENYFDAVWDSSRKDSGLARFS